MAACAKHTKTPAWGYSNCPGCEVERQREQIATLTAERDRYKAALERIASYSPEENTLVSVGFLVNIADKAVSC